MAERGLLSRLPYRPHGAMSRGQPLTLYLSTSSKKNADDTVQVAAHTNMTVLDLIRTASEEFKHPESRTQIVWAGSTLADGAKTLEVLGATDGATLQVRLLKADKPGNSPAPADDSSELLESTEYILPSLVLCSEPSYIATLFELLSANQVCGYGSQALLILLLLQAIAGDVWQLLMRLPTDKAMLEAMLSLEVCALCSV